MALLNRFDYNFDFMGKRHVAMVMSVLLVAGSLFSIVTQGLIFGIDFTGGTLVEVGYDQPVELNEVRSALHGNGFPDAVVQHFGTTRDVLIRLGIHEEMKNQELSGRILHLLQQEYARRQGGNTPMRSELATASTVRDEFMQANTTHGEITQTVTNDSPPANAGGIEMRRVEFVGPQVGGELVEKGMLAVLYTLIGILIYVTIRFEYRLSIGAVAALVHDTIITVGVFSIFKIEFDLTVVAAVLAVIGYSLNDTVVVFDRIRDNFIKIRSSKRSPVEIMNISINQTLSRTIMTSVATLLVVVVLFMIGGELIHGFSLALIIGIIVGTYSSIYIASAIALALGTSHKNLVSTVESE